MKKWTLGLVLASGAISAHAFCTGSAAYQICNDSSGNSYTVQRIGNTTYLDGSSNNGRTWSQTSQTIGNTTFHDGRAANGNSWSGTTTRIGGMLLNDGTDSRGRPYSSSTYTPSWAGSESDEED